MEQNLLIFMKRVQWTSLIRQTLGLGGFQQTIDTYESLAAICPTHTYDKTIVMDWRHWAKIAKQHKKSVHSMLV